MDLIGSKSSSSGLFNTMIDAFRKAIKKAEQEDKTGAFEGDIFNQPKKNKTILEGFYRTAVKVHDQILVKHLTAINWCFE